MTDDIKDTEFSPEVTQDNSTQPSLWQRVQSTGRRLNDGYTRLCANHKKTAFFGGLGTALVGNVGVGFGSEAQSFGSDPLMAAFTAAALGGAVTFVGLNSMDRAAGLDNSFKLSAKIAGAMMVAQAIVAGGTIIDERAEAERQAELETLPQAQEIMSDEQFEAFRSGYCDNSRRFINPDPHKITFNNGQDAIIDCTP